MKVLVLDVECSSTVMERTEILELAVEEYQTGGQDREPYRMCARFRPEHPEWMQPAATRVHGLTEDVLAPYLTFRASLLDASVSAHWLMEWLRRAEVLVGYNVEFDLRVIDAQLALIEAPPWDRTRVKVVDAMKIWQRCERRTLSDAVRRFLRREHEGAHGAAVDVSATADVLDALLTEFALTDPQAPDWDLLLDLQDPLRTYYVGSKHLLWQDGEVVFGFGKMRGQPIRLPSSRDYIQWMLRKGGFPDACLEVVRSALEPDALSFDRWVRERYPEPTP